MPACFGKIGFPECLTNLIELDVHSLVAARCLLFFFLGVFGFFVDPGLLLLPLLYVAPSEL